MDRRRQYGVWDSVAVGSPSTDASKRLSDNSSLVAQSVSSTRIAGTTGGNFHTVSASTVDYGTKRGWRLPLTIASGQRLTYDPQISTGRVFFETMVPTGGVVSCSASSIARYGFVLDPFLGGPGQGGPTFDTNNDGAFNAADNAAAGAFELGAGGGSTLVSIGGPKIGIISADRGLFSVQGATTDARRYWRQIINPPV